MAPSPGVCAPGYVKTVLDAFRLHSEAKSLRPDGLPCDEAHRDCAGLLQRRPTVVPKGAIDNIGKEMNELEDVLAGIVQSEDDLVQIYRKLGTAPFDEIRVLLRAIPMRDLLRLTKRKMTDRTIERTRRGKTTPHERNQERLTAAILVYVSEGGELSFAAIERLDPTGIAAEVRARAGSLTGLAVSEPDVLAFARAAVVAEYEQAIRVGMAALGL